MKDFKIELKKSYAVSAKTIYDAWLDVEAIKAFMCPAEGVTVPNPKMDVREGGSFLFEMIVGDKQLPHKGEYITLDSPHKIQFTWNSAGTDHMDSVVTITIDALDEDNCELTLVHDLLPSDEARNNHNGGWNHILQSLDELQLT